MKCKTIHKKLIFFLEAELPVQEMNDIKNHLENCQDCKAFTDYLQNTLDIIEEEKQIDLNPYFYTRVKAGLEKAETADQLTSQTAIIKILQPVFFSILLLIGIYGGFRIAEPVNTASSQNLAEVEMIPYLNEMDNEPIEAFLME